MEGHVFPQWEMAFFVSAVLPSLALLVLSQIVSFEFASRFSQKFSWHLVVGWLAVLVKEGGVVALIYKVQLLDSGKVLSYNFVINFCTVFNKKDGG